jgi:hypothetical protein
MLHTLDVNVGDEGSTVRNGFKWADLKPSELIELCVCLPTPEDHHIQGTAQIVSTWFGRFQDIPARLINKEHEVRSRQYSGLFASMQHAYGDSFTEDSPVTVITYKRIS